MRQEIWRICGFPRETDWRNLKVTGRVNTASASTTNTASVSFGVITTLTTSKSLTITELCAQREQFMSVSRKGTPTWRVHPGEILREEFLKPMGLSVYELAKRLLVPAPRINDIVLKRRGVTADTAVRLSRFFGTTEQFWLNLQSAYEVSRVKAERGAELERIQPMKSSEARA
jgi:antitoxin HigA-1